MSRKLFAFSLSEIKVVRVICKASQCGVVTELPPDQLLHRYSGNPAVICPNCRAHLCTPEDRHKATDFSSLAAAIAHASSKDARFDIEFILDDSSA